MSHRYLIPENLNGPEPDPEYRECARCGIRLAETSLLVECTDCKGVNAFKPESKRQQQIGGGNFLPVDAAYEVAVHFPHKSAASNDPTTGTLCTMRIPYFAFYQNVDPLEFAYAESTAQSRGLTPEYPIVLIISRGQIIDAWTGYNIAKLNGIPAARKAAVPQPMTTHAATHLTDQENAA